MIRQLAVTALGVALTVGAAGSNLDRARMCYEGTRYGEAVALLKATAGRDPEALVLLGKSCYRLEDYKQATDYLEQAVAAAPFNAEYHLWLGRAYGGRADTSSFLTAPGYASKARRHFERAVELAPENMDALDDLFEYYLEAPGFLGGGLDKAAALAARMEKLNPAEFLWAQATLAEKRKEFATAEQQLRRAAELAPQQVGRFIDLAKFFARLGRSQECESAFQQAAAVAPDSPKLLFAQAAVYVNAGRHLDLARDLLRRYLQSPLTPDDPPRREAERLLKKATGS